MQNIVPPIIAITNRINTLVISNAPKLIQNSL